MIESGNGIHGRRFNLLNPVEQVPALTRAESMPTDR